MLYFLESGIQELAGYDDDFENPDLMYWLIRQKSVLVPELTFLLTFQWIQT